MGYLHRAPLVLPVIAPPLSDGAVLTADDQVVAVGPWQELRHQAPADTPVIEHEQQVLVPALVNAHCHLELAGVAHLLRDHRPEGDLPGWIRRLLEARQQVADDPVPAACQALARLYSQGCRSVIDIGNDPAAATVGELFKVLVFFHLEFLGLAGGSQQQALERLATTPEQLCCTGHAPYSTGAELLRTLQQRARRQGCLLPLHVAESAAEQEFLRTGGGLFADFLSERGVDLAAYQPPGQGAVAWLDSLGLLAEETICAHVVHIDQQDAALLARRRVGICLCPGANRHLGVGIAPLPMLLEHNLRPALGTDSPAGNPYFSMWQEMKVLREDHPGVSPAVVLEMATLAGARLLGCQQQTGVIAPGVDAALPAVSCPSEVLAAGSDAVLDYLTATGVELSPQWIE